jgi:hypothetical protein
MQKLIVSALLIALAAASASAAEAVIKRVQEKSAPAVTLYLQDPAGKPVRLIHTQGAGWTSPSSEPLAVFVDGPSGFTYAWTRDQGWQFIGRLAGDNRSD